MKLLYLAANINDEGGVARVLSVKTDYLVTKLGYEVHILTQNNGNTAPFYPFHKNIIFHDMMLGGNPLQFFLEYRNALRVFAELIKPDIIVVCDNGLKAYTVPFLITSNIPLVLEMHSSRFIRQNEHGTSAYQHLKRSVINRIKRKGIKKYDQFVVETPESIKEWKVDGIVIPNPLWFSVSETANLNAKSIIAVGRHSYEKGFDRLLRIWQKVAQKHPDWMLDVYGRHVSGVNLVALSEELKIVQNVSFHPPISNIQDQYKKASFFVLTSRYEAFGMVLIEAMASGLPVIAYDCPSGPRTIIQNNGNGFLIEDGNENLFVEKTLQLIEDYNLRRQMGQSAAREAEKYNIDFIMPKWEALFKSLVKSRHF